MGWVIDFCCQALRNIVIGIVVIISVLFDRIARGGEGGKRRFGLKKAQSTK